MGPETLAQVLQPIQSLFNAKNFPNLLIGLETSDDAAVYKINESTALIHTLDFFTPIVDDPYDFGAIAAANAMSDVYAMGGEVLLALNICGFPPSLTNDAISEILRGGAEKVAEAGGILAGGHTVIDKEPKYGLSVIGTVHPNKLLAKSKALPGDILILTKPLGVGIITTAAKKKQAHFSHVQSAIENMKMLNRSAAELLIKIERVHACTDITGFSLLGHGYEMAEKSQSKISFTFNNIPFLEGAVEYAEKDLFPGGCLRNQQCYGKNISFRENFPLHLQKLLFTPETSGGLLISLAPEKLDSFADIFKAQGVKYWVIGQVNEGTGIEIT